MPLISLKLDRPTWKRKLLLMLPFLAALFFFSFSVASTWAQGTPSNQASNFDTVGAGLAVGLAGIGAGLAIYGSTSSGLAAMVERPELTTWVLVFAGLGEGIAIYGLVVAILILGRH